MTPKDAKKGIARAVVSKSWLGLASGGGVGFVAFLMLLAPVAAAPPGMYMAPFNSGAAVQLSHVIAVGPGADVRIITPATFSLMTGVAREQVTVSVNAQMTPTTAAFTSTLGVSGLPYTPTITGPHLLTVGWQVGFRANMNIVTKVPTLNTGMFAHLALRATAYVVEQTSGKILPGSQVTSSILLKDINSGKFVENQGLTAIVLRDLPVSLTANHVYLITTVLSLDVVTASTPAAFPGNTASVNFALNGPSGLSYLLVL